MRHRKSGRKLKRTSSHRKATLAALSTALLRNKRIRTTVAKAKETRMVVEKIITRAKNAVAAEGETKNVHARREVGRYIKDRTVIGELFGDIAQKVASRNGGYTRIVKLGQRFGDGAEVAILELVDFTLADRTEKEKPKAKKETPKKERKKKEKTAEAAEAGT